MSEDQTNPPEEQPSESPSERPTRPQRPLPPSQRPTHLHRPEKPQPADSPEKPTRLDQPTGQPTEPAESSKPVPPEIDPNATIEWSSDDPNQPSPWELAVGAADEPPEDADQTATQLEAPADDQADVPPDEQVTRPWKPEEPPADPHATQTWQPEQPADPHATQTWEPPKASDDPKDRHATDEWDFAAQSQQTHPEPPLGDTQIEEALGPTRLDAPPVEPPTRQPPPRRPVTDEEMRQNLPRRVPERDPHATQVQRAAFVPPSSQRQQQQQRQPPPVSQQPPTRERIQPRKSPQEQARDRAREIAQRRKKRNRFRSCILYTFLIAFLGTVLVTLLGGGWAWWQYNRIASDLPDISELRANAATFESTYIYDADGNEIYEINDPNAGRRTYVKLDDISPYVIAATIATEDARFWENLGFDPVGILRAVWQNAQAGGTVSGASTITQQLARALLLSTEERSQRTAERKIREIILSAQMRAEYEPDEILELYLNEIYYGNLAYGIEAAAQTYFNKSASSLTLAEASMLAGLPQSPAVYDVYQNPKLTFERQVAVLGLMVRSSGDCQPGTNTGIRINNGGDRICITQEEAIAATEEIKDYDFQPPRVEADFPHWAIYIRQVLEEQYGAAEIYRAGWRVYTTLDPDLQIFAQDQMRTQVESLASFNVSNGALVAIDPNTGHILAMIGSDNYDDELDGQINMALRPRQPGSSIKPFTYLSAFELGWTPATLIWDVPSEFPDGINEPYVPRNYDGRFHGPLLVRDALANSFNVPAVKALEFVGVYDDPNTPEVEGLIAFLERFGITTLTRQDYGLALTLGGGEITLLEWVNAYATLANQGRRTFPVAITRVTDSSGNVVCEQPLIPPVDGTELDLETICQIPPENWGQQVVSPEHAYQITNILSDNSARYLAFSPGNLLETSVGAAVKTGTTNDIRDVWTMGYTRNLAVGVWMGNADFTPMVEGISSSTSAARVWNAMMNNAFGILGLDPGTFVMPPTVNMQEICYVTGAGVNDYCRDLQNPFYSSRSGTRLSPFTASQPPLPPEDDIIATIQVEQFSGKLIGDACRDLPSEEKTFLNIDDPFALDWLQNNPQGQEFAAALKIEFPVEIKPTEECGPNDARPELEILIPREDGEQVTGEIEIWGIVNVANGEFSHYVIDWGIGDNPEGWGHVTDPIEQSYTNEAPGLLVKWDTNNAPEGIITIRLRVFDKQGHEAEVRRILNVVYPTASPTPIPSDTATATQTPIPSQTPTPSRTPAVTSTVAPTGTTAPTDTKVPVDTVVPTDTTIPADTPIPTDTVAPTDTTVPADTPIPTDTPIP